MPATEPIRNKNDLRALARYFLLRGQYRNHAMIVLGSHTALRISDLLRLRWSDVYDSRSGKFKKRFSLTEGKTKKRKIVTLHPKAIEALNLLFEHRRKDSEFIFAGNRKDGRAISRIQAWRVIHAAVELLHIAGIIAPHSLRKTFGYHAWADNNMPAVVLMEIFNHSSFEVTRRYLGIGQDELDEAYLSISLF